MSGSVASVSVRPANRVGLPGRAAYEGVFGLLLVALMLVSTLDDAVAPIARALFLAGFAILTIINAGAAFALYVAATVLFAVHHSGGNLSYVRRPDNIALLVLTLYLLAARCFGGTAGRFGRTALVVAMLLLVAVVDLVALVGLEWFWLTWFARMFGIPLTMFVLLRRAALSGRELRALWLIVGGVGIYLAIVTLFEVVGWYHLILPPWIGDPNFNPIYGAARAGGVAMQPEWNALLISLALCVLLLRFAEADSRAQTGWLFGCALCLVAIYFCYTRAAYLGLMAAAVPLFWQRSAAAGVTVRRRVLLIGGVLGFAAFMLFFPSEMLRGRVSDTGNVYFRLNVWAAGFAMIKEHPLLGVGFGQFSVHLLPNLRDLTWIPSLSKYQTGTLAHNTFLSVAAELGLVGLALYLLVIKGAFKAACHSAERVWGEPGRIWVTAFSLVYFVNIQFITAHELAPNLLYFGVMGALAGLRAQSPPSRDRARRSRL